MANFPVRGETATRSQSRGHGSHLPQLDVVDQIEFRVVLHVQDNVLVIWRPFQEHCVQFERGVVSVLICEN